MEKVTFKNSAAQGDILLRRIDSLPPDATKITPSNGVFVAGHSQTGHHHVIDAAANVRFYDTDNQMISYLEVMEAANKTETLLRHLREYDTHKAIVIPPGIFEIRRQRQNTPQGWQRVSD